MDSDDERERVHEPKEKRNTGPRKRIFTKEIRQIMYGNGDVLNPAEDTADVMEDMLLMFIEDLCTKTLQASSNGRLKLTDLTYVLRKDPKKLGRVLELIALDKELAKTRNAMGDEATLKGKNLGGKRMRDDDDDDGRGSGDERYEGGLALPNNSDQNQQRDQDNEDDEYDDIMVEGCALYDTATNGTFSKLVNFTSSDPACGGPGISSRLAKVYGHVINEKDFQLSGLITDAETPNAPRLITGVTSAFTLVPDGTGRRRDDPVDPDPTLCIVNWVSDKIPTPGSYVLDNKSPICGPQAPVLVDNTEKYRERLAVVGADSFGNVVIGDKVHQTVFKYAYAVDSAAVSPIKVLSKSKFSFSVTSNATSPTDANSCVYTYVSQDSPANTQEYVLESYTLGSLSLQNGTDINDGCITTAISTYLGQFQFTNTSQACGPTDPTSRFQRYFGGDKNVVYNALTVGSGVFNVSSGEPDSNIPHGFGRRDPGDASFHYINKDLIQATASSVSTSTIATTFSSATSTIATSSTAASSLTSKAATSAGSITTTAVGASVVFTASAVLSPTTDIPTGYAAPNAFTAPNPYGTQAANNVYKGDAAGRVGIFSAFMTAVTFAL